MSEEALTLRRHRPMLVALVIVVVAVAAASGLLAGYRLAAGPSTIPGDESIDAGFARDMQAHHVQAVEMSMLVLDRTQDAAVRTLATDVLLTQQQQVGQLYGWLEQWDLPQTSSRPVMAWMPDGTGGMSGMHGSTAPTDGATSNTAAMPGMASAEELQQLADASGPDADRLYLQLMIPHHQGALAMAEVAATRASDVNVRHLARTIVDSQTAELSVLRAMLAERGGPMTGP